MPTVQVEANLSPEKLLEAANQLSVQELGEFLQQVSSLHARRRTPHLSSRETKLLKKINKGISETAWQRYKELVQRRQEEQLMVGEQEELLQLSNQIELAHAQRMEALVELAQLRNVPLRDLMNSLGIKPLNHA